MLEETISVVSPGAYVVSDASGDLVSGGDHGLFHRDVRHLSRFVLKINGESPVARSSRVRGSRAEFVLESDGLRVVRVRELGAGVDEEISLLNYAEDNVEAVVEVECGSDFLDVFEVRGYGEAKERGEVEERTEDGVLRLSYRREEFRRGTVIGFSGEGVEPIIESGKISLKMWLSPGETGSVSLSVVFEEDGKEVLRREPGPLYENPPEIQAEANIARTWKRSVEDLESLTLDAGGGILVPAAGSPWYMALFGRDSLITSWLRYILACYRASVNFAVLQVFCSL